MKQVVELLQGQLSLEKTELSLMEASVKDKKAIVKKLEKTIKEYTPVMVDTDAIYVTPAPVPAPVETEAAPTA